MSLIKPFSVALKPDEFKLFDRALARAEKIGDCRYTSTRLYFDDYEGVSATLGKLAAVRLERDQVKTWRSLKGKIDKGVLRAHAYQRKQEDTDGKTVIPD